MALVVVTKGESMQESLDSFIEQRKLFAPFHWTLNIATQEFNVDGETPLKSLFPNSFDGWLELIGSSYRQDVEQLFESVCQNDTKRACIVALWAESERGFYLSFSAEKLSQYVIQGEMQFIFEVKQEQHTMSWFDFMLRQDNCGLLITNSDNKILACNKRFERLSGFSLVELLGLNSILLFDEDPSVLEVHTASENRHFSIKHSSGELRQCRASSISLACLEQPNVSITMFSLSPSVNQALETSVMTKQSFSDQLDAMYQSQIANTIYVVMTLNIENRRADFQTTLNDVMSRLKESQLFGKIKDNLYLACIKCSSPVNEKPYRYLHRQIKHFFQELRLINSDIYHSVSKGRVGISVLGVDASNAKMAVTHSVQAILEQHSEERGHHIRFFDSELHRQIKKRKLLEDLVSELIENKRVEVKYQAIVDTQSWQISGYEALFELSLPAALSSTRMELESVVQDLNLSSALDTIIQQQVLKELTILQSYHSNPIFVTLSCSCQYEPKQFADVLSGLVRQLHLHKLSPHHIRLLVQPEIVSSLSAQDLKMWQHLGLKFVIDNIDIKHVISSEVLSKHYHIFKLTPDYLEFLSKSPMSNKVIKALTDECHTRNVLIDLDGVTNLHDAKLLAWLGVDYMSGTLFSEPQDINLIAQLKDKVDELKASLVADDIVERNVNTLQSLCHAEATHLDTSDTVAVAQQYFISSDIEVLPVINRRECIGIIDRACLNLHLTPHMGTDLETTHEHSMWHRPVNQIMKVTFTKLDAKIDISSVSSLIENEGNSFPWVLTEGSVFKGIVTQSCVIRYLSSENLKRTS